MMSEPEKDPHNTDPCDQRESQEVHPEIIKVQHVTKGDDVYSSGQDCKDQISADQAKRSAMKTIVTATMKFEAEHEECLRVLPYAEGDQMVVQLYVFSGESGIPESLKVAAQKCFGEMEVNLKWSDLYNDAANVLNITPIVYPSAGEPKILEASQVDEISEIISKHLHVFDKHRNITAVQASFKITESKQTENPCIAIYVLGKGYIPVGESEFPHTVGPYPVDVVDGFWYRTRDPWTPNGAQEQSEVLCLGASIGVNGEGASGTLGAIVEDGNSGTFYALSCDHVMRHPALDESLNHAKYHFDEYNRAKDNISEPCCLEARVAIESPQDLEMFAEKFKELKTIKEELSDCERCTKETLRKLEEHVKSFLEEHEKVWKITEIIHPGLNDHLNNLKYHLNEYRNWIARVVEPDCLEVRFAVESLQEPEMLLEKFKDIKAVKEKYRNSGRGSEQILKKITKHEKRFETGLQPPRVVGNYIAGVSRNVKWTDGKEYFVDAAIAKLTADEVKRLRQSEIAKMIGTAHYPSGKCSPATTQAIMSAQELCKNGKTTGYTRTDRLVGASVDPPLFMKPSLFQTSGNRLFDVGMPNDSCQECAEGRIAQYQREEIHELDFPRKDYKEGRAIQCENLWRKNCLCIVNGKYLFADQGDSGAVIFAKRDENLSACLPGFGIVFAVHENAHKRYTIASPLEVVLNALSQEISKDKTCNFQLVSKYL